MSGEEECSFRGTSRLGLMKNEIKHNVLSHSRIGPKGLWPSVSNYVLQLSSSENPHLPVAFFYFLDSGGGSYPQLISSAQVEWFNSTTQKLNPYSRCTYMNTLPFFSYFSILYLSLHLNVMSYLNKIVLLDSF